MSSHLSISVIVPVYNAEKHLKDCIDCLLSQDFDQKFEILVIDDASTDKSQKIIKEYKSPLIKLVSLKKNKGPASARNEGIKIAKGEYIYFLDADDLISKNSFKILHGKAQANKLDLIMSDKKVIESSKNQRENVFVYNENTQADKAFGNRYSNWRKFFFTLAVSHAPNNVYFSILAKLTHSFTRK